jgi:hypothetical protein
MLTKLNKDDRVYMLSHVRASEGRTRLPHAVLFPYLGVQVMDGAVWSLYGCSWLGELPGATARVSGDTGLTGGMRQSVAFVVIADGTVNQHQLRSERQLRNSLAEAVRFNLMAGSWFMASTKMASGYAAGEDVDEGRHNPLWTLEAMHWTPGLEEAEKLGQGCNPDLGLTDCATRQTNRIADAMSEQRFAVGGGSAPAISASPGMMTRPVRW